MLSEWLESIRGPEGLCAVRKFKASIRVLSVFQSFKETRAAIHTTH